jgi:hypothetical protein
MLDILILLLCLAFLWQPTEERFQAAMVYGLLIGAQDLVFANSSGWVYFPSDALCNAITIYLLCRIGGDLSKWLVLISLAAFLGNGYGFLQWVHYAEPHFYAGYFKALYSFALFILIGGDPHAWRDFRSLRVPWILVVGRKACRESLAKVAGGKDCRTH